MATTLKFKSGPMSGTEFQEADMGKVSKLLEGGQVQYVKGPLSNDLLKYAKGVTSNVSPNGSAQITDPTQPRYPSIDSWLKKDSAGNYNLSPNLSMGTPGDQWQKLMLQKQGLAESQARDNAAQSLEGRTQQAYSDLSSSGGMSRGARERIARQTSLDDLVGRNQLQNQFQGQRLDIGTNAQGMNTDAKKFDINAILTQKKFEDAQKLGKYGEEMKAWAAGKQADATENSGKK